MPDDKLFFSKLVTKDLKTVDSNRRLFEGVLTVEMKDRQGEITVRDELLKVLPIWIARGGPITDTHSNRVVGQGINFGSTCITDSDGKSYPAITITGEIFKDYELDNEIWGAIKSGKYKGLSFGGATKSARTPIMQKDGSMAYSLKDLEQYEVAVCEEPAVPLALITQHNEVAKAMAGNVQERGDGTMCIRCDKFKCYVEKGDDSFADVRGPNTPNKDDEAEALENNRGEPQENGATYHGTDKTYRDPDPTELDPKKIEANALQASKEIQQIKQADDDKAMDVDDKEMLEEADLKEIEKLNQEFKNKILPLVGAAAGAIGGAARAAAPAIAGAVRGAAGAARNAAGSAAGGAAARVGSAASSAAGGARGAANNAIGSAMGACESEDSCDGGFTCHSYTLDKKYESDPSEIEYGETNEAGEKVNRFGRKIPGVMSKKPSEVDTAQDKPGSGRFAGKPAPVGVPVAPSSPNMTGEALQRRQTGNWNKPTGKDKPKQDKVGNRKVRARSTVTHDKETGITTVDPSKTRGGSKKIVRMPTESYFNNPKYVRGKALDLLNLALTMKFKPVTSEARRGLVQGTKVPGSEGNQEKLQQESEFINTGTKIKPSKPQYTDEQIEAMKAIEIVKVEIRKREILHEIELLKTDYNTDEVVREYTDEEDDKKKGDSSNNYYGEPPHGGNAGREPGETRDNESQSNLHPMNKPVKDDDADALKKDSLVKIEDNEDEDTKVTVLDEWKHEQHPDKNNGLKKDALVKIEDDEDEDTKVTVLDEWSKDKKKNDILTKTEQKLHASVGSSSFIHDRHFITTDGNITAHSPKSHEDQVKGIGHKDLSSFMKQTGAARVTHNDKNNEFSVHSHHPYTDSQTRTIRNHIRDNRIDPSKVIHDNYHDKGPGETGAAHTHNSAMFPKGNHTNMSDDVLSDVDKNDRAMTANNAEDGVNGKMRLDNDEPAESFDEPTNKSEKKEAQNDKDINTGDVETIEGTFIDREANPGEDTSETLQKTTCQYSQTVSSNSKYEMEGDDPKDPKPGRSHSMSNPGRVAISDEADSLVNQKMPASRNTSKPGGTSQLDSMIEAGTDVGMGSKHVPGLANESLESARSHKSINIADPGHGSGGVRVGAAYDNSQQGTGQKDDPRVEEEEEYTGEEDRGPRQKEPRYSGEGDTVTGSSIGNYNKSILDLLKLQFDLKKRI